MLFDCLLAQIQPLSVMTLEPKYVLCHQTESENAVYVDFLTLPHSLHIAIIIRDNIVWQSEYASFVKTLSNAIFGRMCGLMT